MATIYDVAREAGVSPKTVSRVLNGDAPVGTKTRKQVADAIDALGYVPSPAARMMRSNRSGLIGLITGAISLPTDGPDPTGLPDLFIVQGVQRVLGASPMTLMIADTGGRAEAVPGLIETFRRHRVEGLIYVAEYHAEVALPPLNADEHLVLVNCYDAAGTPAVVPDDRSGQRALVRAIIGAGHRRIAYLTLDAAVVATRERTAGYRDALAEAGIAFDPALVLPGELPGGRIDQRAFAETVAGLLAMPDPPTVICCGNDKMAIQAYGVLRDSGFAVPDAVSVAGFDNYRVISETLFPPLTTAELPYHEMGERATRRLLARIAGADTGPALETVPGPVCWRASVRTLKTSLSDPSNGG